MFCDMMTPHCDIIIAVRNFLVKFTTLKRINRQFSDIAQFTKILHVCWPAQILYPQDSYLRYIDRHQARAINMGLKFSARSIFDQ